MKKTTIVVLIICGGLFSLFSGPNESSAETEPERFRQYLIGIKYLETANELSHEEKVAYYEKLVALTDFTADKAKKYLMQYKDDPEKWEKIISSVIKMLENSNTKMKE